LNWAWAAAAKKSAAAARLRTRLARLLKAAMRWASARKRGMAIGRLPIGHCNERTLGKLQLLAVAAAVGHPLTPFVVGKEGGGDNEDGENAEEDFHGAFRIA
jgi:hypothetical protein